MILIKETTHEGEDWEYFNSKEFKCETKYYVGISHIPIPKDGYYESCEVYSIYECSIEDYADLSFLYEKGAIEKIKFGKEPPSIVTGFPTIEIEEWEVKVTEDRRGNAPHYFGYDHEIITPGVEILSWWTSTPASVRTGTISSKSGKTITTTEITGVRRISRVVDSIKSGLNPKRIPFLPILPSEYELYRIA